MLAAANGHKDAILILIQRGANLDLVNAVSVQCAYVILQSPNVNFLSTPLLISKSPFYSILLISYEIYPSYYQGSNYF